LSAQGFNEGKGKPFTAEDIRFTTKGETLFAIAMGWPEGGRLTVKSLGLANLPKAVVETVELLGIDGQLEFSRDAEGLTVTLPITPPCQYAYALKVCGTALR